MKRLLFVLVLLTWSPQAIAAGLQLSIQDGKVSLDAEDVTLRQILAEWARVGRTRIVNVERLSGGPVKLKLEGVPEKQALDILLRAVPGYMASPRQALVANASVYDTILIMATTTSVAPLRNPNPALGTGGAANMTQLRQGPPPQPAQQEPESAAEQQDDPAIAAAAAAGLMAAPASAPGPMSAAPMPLSAVPTTRVPGSNPPLNPWNAPIGSAQPSLAPPPPPAAMQPVVRPRPPQADQ